MQGNMKEVALVVRTGRLITSIEGYDSYYSPDHIRGIKSGSPEAMLAYTIGSAPHDLKKVILSVNDKRKESKEFDEFFSGKSTYDVVRTLVDNDILLKYTGNNLGNVQCRLLEDISFEPVVRDNTPDKDIMERIYDVTGDENLLYAIGKKELSGKECIVYNEIKKYYEDTCRNTEDVPYPRYAKTLTIRDLVMDSVCIEFTKDDLYGTIYELMNKNMLVAYKKYSTLS